RRGALAAGRAGLRRGRRALGRGSGQASCGPTGDLGRRGPDFRRDAGGARRALAICEAPAGAARRVIPLGPDGFAALTGVSRETVTRLEAYAGLLRRWSGRINLVGRNTLGDLWRRHFLDAAQLRPLISEKARSLVDLGSGAGFPGLVLAILGVPGVELIESDKRKAVFLREVARITNAPVKIVDSRIEATK